MIRRAPRVRRTGRGFRLLWASPATILAPPPLPEPVIDYVDEIVIPNLEKALEGGGFRKVLGKYGGISLIHKARKGGATVSVFHIVFDLIGGEPVIAHLGLKGVKGWDYRSPDRVALPREFDFARHRKKRNA